MSDNRTPGRLDDAAVERLLGGVGDGVGDSVVDGPRARALSRLLRAAAAPAPLDAHREEMAVAAFRAVRAMDRADAPGRPSRGLAAWRRRGAAVRPGPSARLLAGALAATAVLGGVAVAAVSDVLPRALGPLGARPVAERSAGVGSATPRVGAPVPSGPESPAGGVTGGVPSSDASAARAARDTPLCRALAEAARRNGTADPGGSRLLAVDAGGRAKVRGYCVALLGATATGEASPGESYQGAPPRGRRGGEAGGQDARRPSGGDAASRGTARGNGKGNGGARDGGGSGRGGGSGLGGGSGKRDGGGGGGGNGGGRDGGGSSGRGGHAGNGSFRGGGGSGSGDGAGQRQQ